MEVDVDDFRNKVRGAVIGDSERERGLGFDEEGASQGERKRRRERSDEKRVVLTEK